jgi:predicted nucleic acid-binding Zn ribbon protein
MTHRRAPRDLSSALQSLRGQLAPATTLARVQSVWVEVVGSGISTVAEPASEREGTLTVACQTAPWAQELDLMSQDIVRKINAALGESLIRELRCRAVVSRRT